MLVPAAGAVEFSDVPGSHWAYHAIQQAAERKVIEGVGNGKFAPGQPVSYAAFSTMLVKAFYPAEAGAQTQGGVWWRPYAAVMDARGLTGGTQIEDERAWVQVMDTPVSRNEMAVLLYNLAAEQGFALPGSSELQAAQSSIADFDTIPGQYRTAVSVCYAAGLLTGGDGGRFNGENTMTRAEAAVVMSRLLNPGGAGNPAAAQNPAAVPLQSSLDWSEAKRFDRLDNSVSRPKTGYAIGYYTIANGDGTVSGLVVDNQTGTISVERFDAGGKAVSMKTLPQELPMFGAFFPGRDYNYIAYGQRNDGKDDSQEVWRIIQYDKDWNRVGAVSANGRQTYTTEPFRSTVARMSESADGKTVVLYAARTRYDGHQSNITFIMDAAPFQMRTVMGEKFPKNHVSHSFGQFVQFDGSQMVTVDHGDAYPRSFVLQTGGKTLELFQFAGAIGDNVTNAIGSGFACSDSGYLFLACSARQDGSGQNWQVVLLYTDKNGRKVEETWLTDGSAHIDCARLVRLDENTFAALWGADNALYYRMLDGRGKPMGETVRAAGIPMPPTQPVVQDGGIRWIQLNPATNGPCLYTLTPQR